MGTTAEKLSYLNQTKQQLKTAINNKGGELTDNDAFRDYVGAVNNIVTEQHTDYAGPYTVTENGTLQTAGKAMTSNLTVTVQVGNNPLNDAFQAYKTARPTNWRYAFKPYNQVESASSRITSFDGIDFSGSQNVTNMEYMFAECVEMTTAPFFDTSACQKMNSMFGACLKLTTVPLYDTSNVTDMSNMFANCNSLRRIPAFNTSNVTNMSSMFTSCRYLSLPELDTSKVTSMSSMFSYYSGPIPLLDSSNVTNMGYMFTSYSGTTIPAFNASSCTSLDGTFNYCSSLTAIHMFGMKVNFNIRYSTQFDREALVEIINNCADLTGETAQTLTMGSTNLAKLTADDIAIATAKNWTLA